MPTAHLNGKHVVFGQVLKACARTLPEVHMFKCLCMGGLLYKHLPNSPWALQCFMRCWYAAAPPPVPDR